MKRIRYLVGILVFIPLIINCSGGGSGSNDSSDSRASDPDPALLPFEFGDFEGSESQAFISREDAQALFIDVISTLALVKHSADGVSDGVYGPRIANEVYEELVAFSGAPESDLSCQSGRIDDIDKVRSSTGLGTFTRHFHQCVSDGLTYHGSIIYKKNSDSVSVTLDKFAYYDDTGFSGIHGTININGEYTDLDGKANLHMINSGAESVKLENYRFWQSGTSGTGVRGQGKLVYETSGYLEFNYDASEELAVSGSEQSNVLGKLRSDFNSNGRRYILDLSYGSEHTIPSLSVAIPFELLAEAFLGTNQKPDADIKPEYETEIGSLRYPTTTKDEPIRFNALDSNDPNYDFLDYQWAILEAPEGCEISLKRFSSTQVDLVPGCHGEITIELLVSDGDLNDKTDIVLQVEKESVTLELLSTAPVDVVLNQHIQVEYSLHNPDLAEFNIGLLPPFDGLTSNDNEQLTIDWQAVLPIMSGTETINLPLYTSDSGFSVTPLKIDITGERKPFFFYASASPTPMSHIVDRTGDGDYVFLSHSDLGLSYWTMGEYYQQQWTYPLTDPIIDSVFYDFDGDNKLDILGLTANQLLILDTKANKIDAIDNICPDTATTNFPKNIRLSNIDYDEQLEIIIHCKKGIQVYEQGNTDVQWTYPNSRNFSLYIGDIDKAEGNDLVLYESQSSFATQAVGFTVLDYSSKTASQEVFGSSLYDTKLADVDGDGKLEVIQVKVELNNQNFLVNAYNPYDLETLEHAFSIERNNDDFFIDDSLYWLNLDGLQGDELIQNSRNYYAGNCTDLSHRCLSIRSNIDGQFEITANYLRNGPGDFLYADVDAQDNAVSLLTDAYSKESDKKQRVAIVNGTAHVFDEPLDDPAAYNYVPSSYCYANTESYHDIGNRTLTLISLCNSGTSGVFISNIVFDLAENKIVFREKRRLDKWKKIYQVTDVDNNGREEILYSEYDGTYGLYDWHSGETTNKIDIDSVIAYEDFNNDGAVELITEKWNGSNNYTIAYYDIHAGKFYENPIVSSDYRLMENSDGLTRFAIDPNTRDLYVLYPTDERSLLSQFTWNGNSYSFRQSIILKNLSRPKLSIGDINMDGKAEVYILSSMPYPEFGTQFIVLNKQFYLLEKRLSNRKFNFLYAYHLPGLGDLFIGYKEYFDNGSNNLLDDNSHLYLLSPFMDEEIWQSSVSLNIGINNDRKNQLLPFLDQGRFRILISGYGGFYVTP